MFGEAEFGLAEFSLPVLVSRNHTRGAAMTVGDVELSATRYMTFTRSPAIGVSISEMSATRSMAFTRLSGMTVNAVELGVLERCTGRLVSVTVGSTNVEANSLFCMVRNAVLSVSPVNMDAVTDFISTPFRDIHPLYIAFTTAVSETILFVSDDKSVLFIPGADDTLSFVPVDDNKTLFIKGDDMDVVFQ